MPGIYKIQPLFPQLLQGIFRKDPLSDAYLPIT